MANWENTLEELCEKVTMELNEANKKLEMSGGQLTAGDVEYIDKLTHTLKSIKTVLAMSEYSEEGGQSNRSGRSYNSYRGSYEGGMSRDSYARGRNARRDSRGRYSSEYSRGREEMTEQLYELMEQAPDDKTRKEFERFIQKMEQ